MLKRPCARCGLPTRGSLCPTHLAEVRQQARQRDNRPSRQARGYDAEYERNRRDMIAHAAATAQPCIICGRGFGFGQPITAEHIIPRRHGGTNARENLGPAHQACNSGWKSGRRLV